MVRWTLRDLLRLYLPCLLVGGLLEFLLAPLVLGHRPSVGLPLRLFAAFVASFDGFVLTVLFEDRRRRRMAEVVRDVMES